ncbi:MAG: GlsB/YeaQ/YmgE family stress response membrane protein [Candidatus Promineifilaceae bacterium]|nr:GlsB/YeaQ/YmgE family stress response membrane protein [Candidatus Promineifilaceae bacterium]
MCGLIGWIVLGGLVGWVASKIMGSSRQQGCIMDVVVGVVGAFLGGLGYNLLTGQGLSFTSAFDLNTGLIVSFLVAVVGAVVLLLIVRAISR